MLAIVEPADLDAVLAICERWEVRAIGDRQGHPRSRHRRCRRWPAAHPRRVGRRGPRPTCPAASLHEDAPLYDRPRASPAERSTSATPARAEPPAARQHRRRRRPARPCWPTPPWVWSQYDHQLFLNTVEGPGGDAAVLRLKHPVTGVDTGRGLALTTDGNHRWCAVDPRAGHGPHRRRVDAQPGLRRGPPARRRELPQLRQPRAPRGHVAAVGGHRRHGRGLHAPSASRSSAATSASTTSRWAPTSTPPRSSGMLGVIDQLDRRPPGRRPRRRRPPPARRRHPARALAARVWAARPRPPRRQAPRRSTSTMHRKVADVVRTLVNGGLLAGVHDVGNGGLGVALAEMAVALRPRRQRRPGRRRRRAVLREPVAGRAVRRPRPAHRPSRTCSTDAGVPRQPHRRRRRRPGVGEGPARPAAGRGRRLLGATASLRPSAPARRRTRCPPGSQGQRRRAGTMAR